MPMYPILKEKILSFLQQQGPSGNDVAIFLRPSSHLRLLPGLPQHSNNATTAAASAAPALCGGDGVSLRLLERRRAKPWGWRDGASGSRAGTLHGTAAAAARRQRGGEGSAAEPGAAGTPWASAAGLVCSRAEAGDRDETRHRLVTLSGRDPRPQAKLREIFDGNQNWLLEIRSFWFEAHGFSFLPSACNFDFCAFRYCAFYWWFSWFRRWKIKILDDISFSNSRAILIHKSNLHKGWQVIISANIIFFKSLCQVFWSHWLFSHIA